MLNLPGECPLPTLSPAPVVILVRPQMAENIGAAARAMANFGAGDLRLVNPLPFDLVHAGRMACDGLKILENSRRFPDLKSALADCAYSIATSRRFRRVDIPPLNPREASERLVTLPTLQTRALVFGSEQSGLSNEDLFLCDCASYIPTTEQGSLNLSQAVLLYLYEWHWASQSPAPLAQDRLATHSEKQRAYELLTRLVEASEYRPKERLPEFQRRVKLLFESRPLTHREQRIWLKLLRYLEKKVLPK